MRKYLLILMMMCVALTSGPAAARVVGPRWSNSNELGRVLVVYYSFTGNTAQVAEAIAGQLNGDLYRIETPFVYEENPRPQVKIQREHNQWPAIEGPLPEIGAYDTVFIGMPVWMGDVPPPVVTFLQQADFNGKRIAYFCTCGPKLREFMDNFRKYVNAGEIVAGNNFADLYQDQAKLAEAVNAWLAEIDTKVNP